jgi:drug/metabolite transporter (DMT)-like permease
MTRQDDALAGRHERAMIPSVGALLPAYLVALAATALWGTQPPLVRLAVAEAGFLSLAFARALASALPLLAILVWQRGWQTFALLLSQAMLFYALTRLTASAMALIYYTAPLFVAIFAALWLGERLRRTILAGVALAFAGVALLTLRGAGSTGTLDLVGVAAALLGAITWALYTVGGRHLLARYEPLRVVALTNMISALSFLPLALLLEPPEARAAPLWVWLIVIALGVLAIGLGNVLWYRALQRLPAAQVGAFMYTIPLWAMLLGWLWLGEPITPTLVSSAVLVFAGLWLAQRR